VSGNEWLSIEPFDYDWVYFGPVVGCNRLDCSECGVQVRTLLGFDLPADSEAAEVYDLVGKNDSSRFSESATYRIYTCRHYSIVAKSKFPVEQQNEYAEWTPWKCAGHPAHWLPARVDGITVDEQSDFGELARKSFAGELGISLHVSVDGVAGFWLQRLYRLLCDLPAAAKVAAAAADQLLDPDPRVRMGAIAFFSFAPNAPGADRLAPALRDHPELFAGVLVDGRLMTLERQLLEVLDSRIISEVGDTLALELMRAALSRPFKPIGLEQYLFGMARVDQKWLLDHGDALVAAVPELWENMQTALESAGASKRQMAALKDRVRARRATP
jgi:hypothetical protein